MRIYTGISSIRGFGSPDNRSIDINYLKLFIVENAIFFYFICISEDSISLKKASLFAHFEIMLVVPPNKNEKIL